MDVFSREVVRTEHTKYASPRVARRLTDMHAGGQLGATNHRGQWLVNGSSQRVQRSQDGRGRIIVRESRTLPLGAHLRLRSGVSTLVGLGSERDGVVWGPVSARERVGLERGARTQGGRADTGRQSSKGVGNRRTRSGKVLGVLRGHLQLKVRVAHLGGGETVAEDGDAVLLERGIRDREWVELTAVESGGGRGDESVLRRLERVRERNVAQRGDVREGRERDTDEPRPEVSTAHARSTYPAVPLFNVGVAGSLPRGVRAEDKWCGELHDAVVIAPARQQQPETTHNSHLKHLVAHGQRHCQRGDAAPVTRAVRAVHRDRRVLGGPGNLIARVGVAAEGGRTERLRLPVGAGHVGRGRGRVELVWLHRSRRILHRCRRIGGSADVGML